MGFLKKNKIIIDNSINLFEISSDFYYQTIEYNIISK